MTEVKRCACDHKVGCTCGAFDPIYEPEHCVSWKVYPARHSHRRGFLWSKERFEWDGNNEGSVGYYDPLEKQWVTGQEATRRNRNRLDQESRIELLNLYYYKAGPQPQKENNVGSCACGRVCGCQGGSTDPFVVTRMKLDNEIAAAQATLERLNRYVEMEEPSGTIRWTQNGVRWFANKNGTGWDVFFNNQFKHQAISWGRLVTEHLICSEDVEVASYDAAVPESPGQS